MLSVSKLTMLGTKDSFTMTDLMVFQSVAFSTPSNIQMDSRAVFTAAGGLAMERTSTKCCFLMDFTAIRANNKLWYKHNTKQQIEEKRRRNCIIALGISHRHRELDISCSQSIVATLLK